jgi:hypothetical protein
MGNLCIYYLVLSGICLPCDIHHVSILLPKVSVLTNKCTSWRAAGVSHCYSRVTALVVDVFLSKRYRNTVLLSVSRTSRWGSCIANWKANAVQVVVIGDHLRYVLLICLVAITN